MDAFHAWMKEQYQIILHEDQKFFFNSEKDVMIFLLKWGA